MPGHYTTLKAVGANSYPVAGRSEPVAHPQNCKHECPYGHDRAFCFPCMAKILSEHRAAKNNAGKE